jgi:uncharacterized membrane protein
MVHEETIDVLMAGYLSRDAALDDFHAVEATGASTHGVVVVSKDLEGNLAIEEHDHTTRKGALAFGGVGFVVGLFAPPLLAATAVGAVIGAGAGKLAHRKLESGFEKQAEETIPIGGAGLIVAYPRSSAAAIEASVTRAIKRATGEATGRHVDALKAALLDAQTKMAATS